MSNSDANNLKDENTKKWYHKFHYHFIFLSIIIVQFNPGDATYVNTDLGSIGSYLYLITCAIFILLLLNSLLRLKKVFNIEQFSIKHKFMIFGLLFALMIVSMNFSTALSLVNRFY